MDALRSLKWLSGPSLPYTGRSASCACAPHSSRAALYAILNLGTATAITLALEDGN